MVLYGLKEYTEKLEISIAKDYYLKLLEKTNCQFEKINEFGDLLWSIDDTIHFTPTSYRKEKTYIEGIPTIPQEIILQSFTPFSADTNQRNQIDLRRSK